MSLAEERRERLARLRLYLITGDRGDEVETARIVEAALEGGATVIQLRKKSMPMLEQYRLALEVEHTHPSNVAREVAFGDELCQHSLFDGRGVAVEYALRPRKAIDELRKASLLDARSELLASLALLRTTQRSGPRIDDDQHLGPSQHLPRQMPIG